mgnify:FL=1|jgi:hypothetical protein|tara:strand:+ start:205 stop:621 length:417 start_codon:yes stop_codon:yes gene_type:complete
MGYTNYWYQHEDFTNDEWHKIQVFFHGLKMVYGGGAYLKADHIINDQTINDSHIQFNGTKGQDYETFTLNKVANTNSDYGGDVAFNFCKTNRNPYDAMVWALLSYARYVKGNRDMFVCRNDDGDHYGSNNCGECGHDK